MTFWTGKHKERPPAWLVGLIIAAIVFGIVLAVLAALGFGDDPVVEGWARLSG